MTPASFRSARLLLGLTQQQLAHRLGLGSKVDIYRKETGRSPISEAQALAVKALLYESGISAEEVAELG